MELSNQSQVMGGILFLSLVAVELGGRAVLRMTRGQDPATDLQLTFSRAGHGHAGMFVTLALVAQVFVDTTDLDGAGEWVARSGIAIAAILIPAAFFLSVLGKGVTTPNRLFVLLPIGAVLLAAGAATLGVGLLAAA
ncbi:MAG TPA: hypothetical protein VK306_05475 [Acidimicrobiales bacterium]|nr:hypothetical protein [Acidimicrobiales bacterium]